MKTTLYFYFAVITLITLRFITPLAEYQSSDISYFLLGWVSLIHDNGISIYSTAFTNYAPSYTYLLGLVSLLPNDMWVWGIKTISIFFDLILAFACGKLVWLAANGSGFHRLHLSRLATLAALLLPTVWLNSAWWGQCDSIWSAFCLLSLIAFIKGSPKKGMLYFAIAFSFKLQSMFFAPVILMLFFAKRIPWKYLFYIPGIYILSCLPCLLAGRPIYSIATVYLSQVGVYPSWFCGAPSPYFWIKDLEYSKLIAALIICTTGILTIGWAMFMARRLFPADTHTYIHT